MIRHRNHFSFVVVVAKVMEINLPVVGAVVQVTEKGLPVVMVVVVVKVT